jgi:hypothetical protein
VSNIQYNGELIFMNWFSLWCLWFRPWILNKSPYQSTGTGIKAKILQSFLRRSFVKICNSYCEHTVPIVEAKYSRLRGNYSCAEPRKSERWTKALLNFLANICSRYWIMARFYRIYFLSESLLRRRKKQSGLKINTFFTSMGGGGGGGREVWDWKS